MDGRSGDFSIISETHNQGQKSACYVNKSPHLTITPTPKAAWYFFYPLVHLIFCITLKDLGDGWTFWRLFDNFGDPQSRTKICMPISYISIAKILYECYVNKSPHLTITPTPKAAWYFFYPLQKSACQSPIFLDRLIHTEDSVRSIASVLPQYIGMGLRNYRKVSRTSIHRQDPL
jgi:hypothetical protein